MNVNRMSGLAVVAMLCCTPAFAQMGAGSPQSSAPAAGSQAGGTNNPSNPNSPAAMQQDGMTNANGMAGMGAANDKMFVKKAIQGSMAEVQMGQLALQKSSDDQVKQFAQKMVDDHGKMIDQMKPVAQQMGVAVPDSPPKDAMKAMDKMKGLSGDAFDQAYIKDMVKDHKKDDAAFKQEASATQNAQLKQMGMESDKIIEGHLQMIEQIAQSKGTGKAAGKMGGKM